MGEFTPSQKQQSERMQRAERLRSGAPGMSLKDAYGAVLSGLDAGEAAKAPVRSSGSTPGRKRVVTVPELGVGLGRVERARGLVATFPDVFTAVEVAFDVAAKVDQARELMRVDPTLSPEAAAASAGVPGWFVEAGGRL